MPKITKYPVQPGQENKRLAFIWLEEEMGSLGFIRVTQNVRRGKFVAPIVKYPKQLSSAANQCDFAYAVLMLNACTEAVDLMRVWSMDNGKPPSEC